jgi:soluble lytic murein transglycosylase
MRGSLLNLLSCLLISTLSASAVHAATLAQQRQYYDQAKAALAKGDKGPYQRHASALRDYPLEPYLAYDELTARLKSASNDVIE